MLRPRIIPCLLVRKRGLVKTVQFRADKYVGDPINAVRIFNEKEADELTILDIDATATGREPDVQTIRLWASECRMPLCYGGGIRTVSQAMTIVGVGVEKVAISSALVDDPGLVTRIGEAIGSQSVVAVLDVKKTDGTYRVWTHNATRNTGLSPVEFSRRLESLGIGEIVLNSIDRDGEMKGYDVELASAVRAAVKVPMSVLGGAGSLDDVRTLIQRFGAIGAAAGSLFVFKGVYRAVLINYPTSAQRDRLIQECLKSSRQ